MKVPSSFCSFHLHLSGLPDDEASPVAGPGLCGCCCGPPCCAGEVSLLADGEAGDSSFEVVGLELRFESVAMLVPSAKAFFLNYKVLWSS